MAKLPGKTQRQQRRAASASKLLFGKAGYTPFKTGRRAGIALVGPQSPVPPMPDAFIVAGATLPEWAIYWAHMQLGLKEGQDFVYRQGLYGFAAHSPGGLQIDFLELNPQRAIDIQGQYFHYQMGAAKQATDKMTRVLLEAAGFPFTAIDEFDAIADPVYYLKEALLGKDHSIMAGRG